MTKVNDAIAHFERLYKTHAVYLWGANCETITPQLCDRLYSSFGSATYSKAYYNNKLRYGAGRIGADCSGSFFPISGFDATAQGYYNKCLQKGVISQIPRDKACLVFKGKNTNKITHIGFYLGDGYVIEMKSSKDDCVKRKLSAGKWQFYGIPNWIEYDNEIPLLKKGSKNAYVNAWQSYLKLAGFYTGEIDSEFGTQTENAVKEWQKSVGLVPDGVIGPECWAKITD